MKHQALFSSKDKSKKSKCRLLQFSFGTFRVKTNRENKMTAITATADRSIWPDQLNMQNFVHLVSQVNLEFLK